MMAEFDKVVKHQYVINSCSVHSSRVERKTLTAKQSNCFTKTLWINSSLRRQASLEMLIYFFVFSIFTPSCPHREGKGALRPKKK